MTINDQPESAENNVQPATILMNFPHKKSIGFII